MKKSKIKNKKSINRKGTKKDKKIRDNINTSQKALNVCSNKKCNKYMTYKKQQ